MIKTHDPALLRFRTITSWLLLLSLACVVSPWDATAQEGEDIVSERKARLRKLEERADRAVEKGLRYLASQQDKDGAWKETVGRKVHMRYQGTHNKHIGVTALACMAFVSHGSLPDRGPFQDNVDRGLDYILDHVEVNGYITHNESRMYSHAFATLFLAEVYGMTGMQKVRDKLKKSVGLIVKAQNEQGGWRYQPGAADADMSITVCQVMALRAARNAGIHVPKEVIDAAIEYVKRSYRQSNGAFYYQIGDRRQRSRFTFALTAAGVTALYGAGEYSGQYIDRGLRYMRREMPRGRTAHQTFDYYYGMYYATQAFFQKGGTDWEQWQEDLWEDLLRIQSKQGYWRDLVGPKYATAMACIILQVPKQYLPIFER